MSGETLALARYVAKLTSAELPIAVVERAKLLVLDFIGSALRARLDAESTPAIMAGLAFVGVDAAGPSTVMGDPQQRAPAVAALLNGILGHSLDFDDTHAESSLHPSAPVVPAAFAVGELVGASGSDVLAAIVAGYEVCSRLGNALDPTSHYARGFHPTATAGTFGAAAAASKLLGLDANGISGAFGISASQAAGSLQFLTNGAWNKRYQVGAAAMNGVIAASLIKAGFVAASEAIEGQHGFLKGYSDNADPQRAVDGLAVRYETMRIGTKPYPSCRYTHAAIDALLSIRQDYHLTVRDIKQVEIGLHQNGFKLTGSPEDTKRRPVSIVDGQFSMPFTAAVALDQGSFGWDDYSRLGDPIIEAIADRIVVRSEASLEKAAHPFGAVVRVTTSRGTHERAVADPSGEPDSFPLKSEVLAKFLFLASPVLGDLAARSLAEIILALEIQPSLVGLKYARQSSA